MPAPDLLSAATAAPELDSNVKPESAPAPQPTVADVLASRAVCATCGAWPAPFGFGVAILSDRPGRWYCSAHAVEGHRAGRTAP